MGRQHTPRSEKEKRHLVRWNGMSSILSYLSFLIILHFVDFFVSSTNNTVPIYNEHQMLHTQSSPIFKRPPLTQKCRSASFALLLHRIFSYFVAYMVPC